MKIRDLIQEFIPCEICGNNDFKNFYFHVLVDHGSAPYVKCCECEEEFYSIRAKNILVMESNKVKNESKMNCKNKIDVSLINKESLHPLVKVLARM